MAEMKRSQDEQGGNRRSDGMGSNQDMQSGRGMQQSKKDWDGTDRRMGEDRRQNSGRGGAGDMIMNEGSSR